MLLHSVMAFHLFLDGCGIGFDGRFASGELLSLSEAEDLARSCRRPLSELIAGSHPSASPAYECAASGENTDEGQKTSSTEVAPDVAASRLRYIRTHLQWLPTKRLSRHVIPPSVAPRLVDMAKFVA